MTTVISKHRLSLKVQTCGAILAMISAVALPQLLHLVGASTGLGTSLGETLLPMHLPIMLAGFLAGPYAAGIAGLLSPLLSFLLTGMPTPAMLPFMMLELAVYGICSGLLRTSKLPAVLRVLLVQLAGRGVRAAAILIGFYALGTAIPPAVILTSVQVGLVGIALQLLLIPLLLFWLKEADNDAA